MEDNIEVYYAAPESAEYDYSDDIIIEFSGKYVLWETEMSSKEKIDNLIIARSHSIFCRMRVPDNFTKSDIKKAVVRELEYLGKTDKEIKDFLKDHRLVKRNYSYCNSVCYDFMKISDIKLREEICKKLNY